MFRLRRILCTIVTLPLVAAGLSACGGSQSHGIPANAVAVVGSTPITRATLNHWMASIVGGDYYEHIGAPAPRGLVSEPPNYSACVAAAGTLVGRTASGQLALTPEQLDGKCRELHQAIKEQALSLLISIQWRIDEAAEHGLTITDGEVAGYLKQLNAKQFPKPGQFETYLADREWAASDMLYQLKRNLLTTRLEAKFQHNNQAAQQAFFQFVLANTAKRTASTDCRVGYVIPRCRQYKATASSSPAPTVILEALAASR